MISLTTPFAKSALSCFLLLSIVILFCPAGWGAGNPVSKANMPFIANDANGARHLNMEITREVLEELVGDIVGRTIENVESCVRDAGLTPDQIDHVTVLPEVLHFLLYRRRYNEVHGIIEGAIETERALYGPFPFGRGDLPPFRDEAPLSYDKAPLPLAEIEPFDRG